MGPVPHSTSIVTHYNSLDYKTLQYIKKKLNPRIFCDNLTKVHFTFYDSAGLNKYSFIEDAVSLKEKRNLAIKYKLRGISVFRLGIEDPAIWKVIEK